MYPLEIPLKFFAGCPKFCTCPLVFECRTVAEFDPNPSQKLKTPSPPQAPYNFASRDPWFEKVNGINFYGLRDVRRILRGIT